MTRNDSRPSCRRTSGPRRRAAFVLIVVLVVVAMLSLGAYTFSELMLSHRESAQLSGRQLQTRSLVDSGVDLLKTIAQQDPQTRADGGGVYDNAQLFRGVVVLEDPDPRDRGSVTLLAPNLDEDGQLAGVRYGLENESARLNLNSLLVAEKAIKSSQQAVGSAAATAAGAAGVDPKLASAAAAALGGSASGAGSAGAGGGSAAATAASDSGPNGRTLLMALPGMTEEIADAILDWLDKDDEPREYGAEVDYYSGLQPAYAPKNGPFETVEELLLVRGVTAELLFGRDVNRNGMIDPIEQNQPSLDGGDGSLDRGWSAYLTLYSMESNRNSQGQPRININSNDLAKLHEDLKAVVSEEWANFIILYRQNSAASTSTTNANNSAGGSQSGGSSTKNGNSSKNSTKSPSSPSSGQTSGSSPTQTRSADSVPVDPSKKARRKFRQVLDLVGATVQVPAANGSPAFNVKSPFPTDPAAMATYLPTLMDHLTVNKKTFIPGRLNVNQAPRTLLEGVPGLAPEVVDEILSRRSVEPDPNNPGRQYESWLLTEGLVTLEEMKLLTPFLCGGGDVYRTQVVGYLQGGGGASRAEVVIDAITSPPRLLLWRDLSHLGRGYALETLGVDFVE